MSTGCQSQKESQIEDLWIPNTPLKHVPPKPSVIYSNRQENQINQPDWLGFEGYSSGFTPQIQADGFEGYSSGFTPQVQADGSTCIGHGNHSFGEAALCAENDSGNWTGRYGMPASIAAECSTASFSSLLALANAADNRVHLWSNPICTTEQHWIAANAFSCQNSNQFTPVTPGNAVREGQEQSVMHKLCAEERQNQQTNEQNSVVPTVIDAAESQTIKEVKSSATDLPFPVVSANCKEDNHPDRGADNGIDLNKTPRQKVRRKKHRPKVITQGKPKRTQKTATAKETPRTKRKYVRKKESNQAPNTIVAESNGEFTDLNVMQPTFQNPTASERMNVQDTPSNKVSATPPAEAVGDFTDREIPEPAKKSCRRALNFYMEGDGDHNNKCKSISNLETQPKSTVYLSEGVEVMVENSNGGIAFDLTRSVNQMLQAYMSLPERQFSSKISSGSMYSTCSTSVKETKGKRSKRKTYPGAIEQQDTSSSNLNGINYNALVAFPKLPVLQFPKMHKKKRTEKIQYSATSTTSLLVSEDAGSPETRLQPIESIGNLSASNFSCLISTDHNVSCLPDGYREGRELYYKQQTIEFGASQKARLTKKRSRDRTRARKLANWHTICLSRQQPIDFNEQQSETSHRPCTSSKALLSEMHTTTTAKGAEERLSLVSLDALQSHGRLILYNQDQMPSTSLGSPKVTWKQMDSVDAITEALKDINIQSSETAHRDQNALVLYQRDGTIVPFAGSSIKKRHPRPKVILDEETTRVWKLLLGNINSEGIDGTDEEKIKWWEEEREVFHGRINSLLARMHLVQGDRRFSPWKGSVVDSVVGVFLTQNVSDHLSSSAFMSLAARFPLNQHGKSKPCCEEGASSAINKPIIHIPDPEDIIKCTGEISDPSVCDQSSMTIYKIELDEEIEVVNSNESSRCSSGCSGTSACYESTVNILPTEHTASQNTCNIEDERAINDAFSSQNSAISSQNSANSSIAQIADVRESLLETNSEAEIMIEKSKPNNLNDATSFLELLQKVGSIRPCEAYKQENNITPSSFVADSASQVADQKKLPQVLQEVSNSAVELGKLDHNIPEEHHMSIQSQNRPMEVYEIIHEPLAPVDNNQMLQQFCSPDLRRKNIEILQTPDANSTKEKPPQSITESEVTEHSGRQSKNLKEITALRKAKSRRVGKEIRDDVDWDAVRKQVEGNGRKRERTANTMDSLDWEAVRCADVSEIAKTIKDRGMNNVLAERIKNFLDRLVKEHGSIDLEWLRDIPPDKAKEYLLSIRGLGLKSVECVRLLTLHHLAFPVDTNVGRIAVRLGWVPLQPLPESLQLHLLELYPVLESIQKYLWPRLCKLDQRTLYELHYQMITFGKVFCTKSKPNCNSCPLRGECRHFASAFASARLSLPGPEERGIVSADVSSNNKQNPDVLADLWPLPLAHAIEQIEDNQQSEENQVSAAALPSDPKPGLTSCVPIIEEPLSPEPERTHLMEKDLEDTLYEDPDEIPTIKLDIEEFTQNLQNYMQQNMELQEGEMSRALVALSAEAASIPTPKLKNVSRLRTEHQVYELPDYHPLLKELDAREPDDPCSYLLAIWTPGETANSIQPPERSCVSQEYGKLCDEKTCFQCNSIREANSQTVRGTLLIPCRTAMRGSFPLNGTYFQVNEVFADHETSMNPVSVPRDWIWNLPRRTVYFGTSIPTIFKGLTMEGIQHCFWRGHVCVRGFDRKTRAPRPLKARLHFPASKSNGKKERNPEN